jgi:hypothetical protein
MTYLLPLATTRYERSCRWPTTGHTSRAKHLGPVRQGKNWSSGRPDVAVIQRRLLKLLGVEVATTRIPHLEGKEIFGSTKRKLDLRPGDNVNSLKTRQRQLLTASSADQVQNRLYKICRGIGSRYWQGWTPSCDNCIGVWSWHVTMAHC